MEWPLSSTMFQAFPRSLWIIWLSRCRFELQCQITTGSQPPILAGVCAAARPLWIPIPQGIGLVTSWL